MAYEKLKSENYVNLGGINQKVSKYIMGSMEFLDLANFDFQTPGSLTKRWGSTQYISQTFNAPIRTLFEYAKLDGSSYIVTSHTGGIWFGATTGTYQGISFSQNLTLTSIYNPQNIFGPSFQRQNPGVAFYQGLANNAINVGASTVTPGLAHSENTLSCAVFQNYMFMADGTKFFKFNGVTTTFVGLPPPMVWGCYEDTTDGSGSHQPISTLNRSNSALASENRIGIGSNSAPNILFYVSYVNDRGFESNIWPLLAVQGSVGASYGTPGTFVIVNAAVQVPSGYGIQSLNLYSYSTGTSQIGIGNVNTWTYPYQLLTNYSFSAVIGSGTTPCLSSPTFTYLFTSAFGTTIGATLCFFYVGSTMGIGQSYMFGNNGGLPDPITNQYLPLGFTLITAGVTTFKNLSQVKTSWQITNFFPRFLEVYQNQLFCAGFSASPSVVCFSDVGEPEGFLPDSNFEVRTNDGDVVTAMRAFSTRLYVFKQNSFHCLYGDNAANYFLQEISLNYGCLNHRCTAVYNDLLVFLDRKGVMQYSGSSIEPLSAKVQPIFDTMNYSAALTQACMVHDKLRNQILVGIPINGATLNNVTMTYDYLTNAWTRADGFKPTAFAQMQGYNTTKNAFYGTASGVINWFGPSFLSDNGVGFTAYAKGRFLHDMGFTDTKQYRQLFIDCDQQSQTLVFNLNFFQDYGTSTVYSTTMGLSQFQSRIDFGIAAKALAFEISNLQSSVPLRVNGFGIAARMQRRT